MFEDLSQSFTQFVHLYGYYAIFLIIAAESLGFLLPGETTLITTSIYAGTTHKLNIFLIILAAMLGAIIGDNIGYLIGRYGGYALLHKFGGVLKIDDDRLKVGQYLFRLHGSKIVFFGRFISFLRSWAAFFAGVNKMHWKEFLLYNALGGIFWAAFYGTLGYFFGKGVGVVSTPIRYAFFLVGIFYLVISTLYLHRNLKSIEEKAKREL